MTRVSRTLLHGRDVVSQWHDDLSQAVRPFITNLGMHSNYCGGMDSTVP